MASRLRDAIKVYDNVIDQDSCENIKEFYQVADSQEQLVLVDVPKRQKYYMAPITAMAVKKSEEAMKLHKFMSRLAIHYFQQYQKDLGIEHEARFKTEYDGDESRDFTESFFMRGYFPGCFSTMNYDARCFNSGDRFLSMVLFLDDDAPGASSFHFDPSLVLAPISAKAGRLVMFPSSWQYPHAEKEPSGEHRIAIYGHYAWYDPSSVKKSIEEAQHGAS